MLDGTTGADTGSDDATASFAVAAPVTDAALDHLAALAADLLDAPTAILFLRDGDRASAKAGTGAGLALRDGAAADLPWSAPLASAGPEVVADLAADGRIPQGLRAAGRFYAGAPILSPDGAVAGVLCVLDAQPRPAPSERDMARLCRLAALAADAVEMRHLRDRADTAVTVRTELLADMSHELRTPLNGIVGFAQLLKRDGVLDPRGLRSVERIEDAGRALLSILGDALDLSKLDSGVVRLDARPFSAARLVEDAAALVGPEAERKGLRLVVDVPERPTGALLGDPDRLRQVLLNLLGNAVKFTGSGTVRIGLAVDPEAATAAPVPLTVTVEDSGVGIADGGIPRLFRRFAQADGSVARRFGGTGLGLAISKRLVEAMGGSIAVESTPGIGARFTVALALPRAIETRLLPPRPRRSLPRDALRGLAILLAEDAAMNQKLVVQMLAPLGAEVDVVADGAAAVAAAARRDYALVLMDMEMPVLGGLDATRRIRALGGPAGTVPIVALTANVFPEQLDLCREAGMDHHLTKPFGPDDLAATVLRWARRLAPAGDAGP